MTECPTRRAFLEIADIAYADELSRETVRAAMDKHARMLAQYPLLREPMAQYTEDGDADAMRDALINALENTDEVWPDFEEIGRFFAPAFDPVLRGKGFEGTWPLYGTDRRGVEFTLESSIEEDENGCAFDLTLRMAKNDGEEKFVAVVTLPSDTCMPDEAQRGFLLGHAIAALRDKFLIPLTPEEKQRYPDRVLKKSGIALLALFGVGICFACALAVALLARATLGPLDVTQRLVAPALGTLLGMFVIYRLWSAH